MKRLLIIADRDGWCFARRAQALQRYAPDGWQVTIDYIADRQISEIVYEQHDLVFLLAPHKAREMRNDFTLRGIDVPLAISHNSGVGRKDYSLSEVLCAADYTIVNNYGAWACGMYGVKNYRACNISNGVDLKTFYPTIPFADRPKKIVWTASRNKADDKHDVKGYQKILTPLGRILAAKWWEVDFRVIEPDCPMMDDAELREFYSSAQVLICASSSEGTPNICLEAAACGAALITSPVGNMPELVQHGRNGFLVRRYDTIGFHEAVEKSEPYLSEASANMMESIQSWDWSVRAPWFYALFSRIIERGAESVKPFTYLKVPPEGIGA